MFSHKDNVNILTSLLVAHGIRHAVVCPGSRNAPIVHNLNECPEIHCWAVTDERSAGFYALGMAQQLQEPVVVCVTSGSALLNVAPAIAEAYYQHLSVIVVSADRPQQWIDQQDGQTLPQTDALNHFVRKAVALPEPHHEEERWYCNRLVNEALIVRHAPVHINVPISEPLFDFSVPQLPIERKIELLPSDIPPHVLSHIVRSFMQSPRPLLITGQPMNPHWDEAVKLVEDDERYVPDLVLYIGGSIVSKRLKHFLRKARETWIVNERGEVTDTFMNLTKVIQGDGSVVADQIRFFLEQEPHPFVQQWDDLLEKIRCYADEYVPSYSQMAAVRVFEKGVPEGCVHYANSQAIRLANIYAAHPVCCNRGVNGIEGSLSTAAGASCVTEEKVFCVIGDLSFFYDQNALWNQHLRGNLRILLLNNGKGGIFNLLKGLEQSAARDALVSAQHHTTAIGICQQNDIVYLSARNMDELQPNINRLLTEPSERPILLEVLTDPIEDERVFKEYYRQLSI